MYCTVPLIIIECISLVKLISKTFAILGEAAAFMHGSNTINGESCDTRMNDLFAYVVYQVAVKNLGMPENSVIHHLSVAPR